MWPVCQVLAGKLVCPLFTYANQTVQGECELVDGRVVLHGEATYTVAGTATLAAIGWERIVFAGTFEHGHFTSGEIRFNDDEQYYMGDLCVGDKPPAHLYQMQHCICEIGEMQFHDDDAALALELWHYHGGFQRGLFHGQGELTLCMGNDDIFEGTFKNGEFCSGKITHTDGSVHEGTFHCAGGCTDGVYVQFEKNCGQLTTPDGRLYQGSFTEHGRPHTGVLTYPNGDKLALTAGS
jgi:hypothetical protein